MATKRTTIKPEPKPVKLTITTEQLKSLQLITERLGDVRRRLEDIDSETNISRVMFNVGSSFNDINWCEDAVDEIINTFDTDEISW